jgi:hypothetical protein
MSSCFPGFSSTAMLDSVAEHLRLPKPYKVLPAMNQPDGQSEYFAQLTNWMQKLEAIKKVPGISFQSWVAGTSKELQLMAPTDLLLQLKPVEDLSALLREQIVTTWAMKGIVRDDQYNPLRIGAWSAYKMVNCRPFFDDLMMLRATEADYHFDSPVFRILGAEGTGSVYVAQLNRSISGPELLKAGLAMIGATKELTVKSLMLPKVNASRIVGEMPWMTGIQVGGATLTNAHYGANLTMDENGTVATIDVQGSFTIGIDLDRVHWKIDGPMVYVREYEGTLVDAFHLDTSTYFS